MPSVETIEALGMVLLQEILAPVGYEAFKPGKFLYQLHLRIILLNLSCHLGITKEYTSWIAV